MCMKDLKEKAKAAAKKAVKWVKGLPDNTRRLANEARNNPKQAAVAGIILLVAAFLLLLVFGDCKKRMPPAAKPAAIATQAPAAQAPATTEKAAVMAEAPAPAAKAESTAKPAKEAIKVEPQNAVLTFVAKADKDFTYEVFYTTEREVWFDAENTIEYPGKAGTHKYSIVLPAKDIFRIRLDFDSNPGEVTIKDIYLTGSQKADLNNFSEYELNQLDKATANEDGSFTIISGQEDPYMAFRPALLPE